MDKLDEQAETPRQPWFSSRRNLLATGAAAGIAGILGTKPAAAAPTENKPQTAHEANVRNFGASGDATANDTAAFQRALDSVNSAGGGTVYAPPGSYLRGEPAFLGDPASAGERGVVVCQLFDARREISSFLLFDAFDVAAGPLAVLPLDTPVHLGFHAIFG